MRKAPLRVSRFPQDGFPIAECGSKEPVAGLFPAWFIYGQFRVTGMWGGHSCPPSPARADRNVRPTSLLPCLEPCPIFLSRPGCLTSFTIQDRPLTTHHSPLTTHHSLTTDLDLAVLVQGNAAQLAVVLGEMDGRHLDVVFRHPLGR